MTRITSLGRKRTYIEAGFTEGSKDLGQRTNDDEQHDKNTANGSAALPLPPKKKRKRTKPSMRDGNTGVKAVQAAVEREKREAEARMLAERGDGQIPLSKSAKKKKRERMRGEMLSSERRRQKRINEKTAGTICFACREKGHSAKDCPSVKGSNDEESKSAVGMCYRCGSKNHTLSRCRKPVDPLEPLPFASCFVCNRRGHLASSCPQNKSKGVYPNGGSCKLCGQTSHLAKDCRRQELSNIEDSAAIGANISTRADEDDFHASNRQESKQDQEGVGNQMDAVGAKPRVNPARLPPKKVVYF